LPHHTETVNTVVFRPRNENPAIAHCASGSDDQTVRIWQPKIGRMVRIIRGHEGPIFALAYSPDGSALFSAGKEGIIRMLDPHSDRILSEWKGHQDAIYCLAFDSTGEHLASGDWSGAIKLWRFKNGNLEANP
jgi:WD40 repeat protein